MRSRLRPIAVWLDRACRAGGSARSASFAAPCLRASTAGVLAVITATAVALGQTNAAPSVLKGAYTEAQALRGQALYNEHCLECHGETMAGLDQAPPLVGPQFSDTWNGEPLQALVDRIAAMPPDRPGSLTHAENVDILTYMLWYNGLPLGEVPLDAERSALGSMTFQIPLLTDP